MPNKTGAGGNATAKYQFADIIGENIKLRNAVFVAKRAAETDTRILLQGASGTGKEVFAQAIHNWSFRKDGPFVPINCGAIPNGLLESELFGYVKGAFTGANREGQIGKFEYAKGGTLFLDEIGEMSFDMQAKLLRVLEEKKLCRVGGNKLIDLDVRIIAATNRDLRAMVQDNKFRDDLYYRLSVVTIYIPPLKQRKDDLPHLINYFLYTTGKKLNRNIKRIEPDAEAILNNYHWPGNIRELENVIERAILLSDGDVICKEQFPSSLLEKATVQIEEVIPATVVESYGEYFDLKEIEKTTIKKAVNYTRGNISKAADLLGISRNTLHRKIKTYKLRIPGSYF